MSTCPHASFGLPWDEGDAPPPVEALREARATLGSTFTVRSGEDDYLFLFSDEGLRSFYGLPERDASKGLADFHMLLRKLPPELFDGRRTFAHDLFGAQEVETYLDRLDLALDVECAGLPDAGEVDAFDLTRRLGHRLGLACWIGPEVAAGPTFERFAADLDVLDGAESFVRPERGAAGERGYDRERRALARLEAELAVVLADRRDRGGDDGGGEERGDDGDFLSRIAGRWSDAAGESHVRGVAGDVVLLHVATMTNLVAALGWTLVRVLQDPDSAARVRAREPEVASRCALEAIRLAQRSIMMRTALRPLEIADHGGPRAVERGTIVATMLPVTNLDPSSAEPGAVEVAPLDRWSPDRWRGRLRGAPIGVDVAERVTTFGHGAHRCPARRFSMSAIVRTLERLLDEFDLALAVATVPEPPPFQIGGVARADGSCPLVLRRRQVR